MMEICDAEQDMEYVAQWSAAPRIGSDGRAETGYPYPDKFVQREATGELAEGLRAAFIRDGVDAEEAKYDPILITEKAVYGGYSEYTQEHFLSFSVRFGDNVKDFTQDWDGSAFMHMLKWIDGSDDEQ